MAIPLLPPEIFKAYDIRGIVGRTLTPPIVRAIGQALGSLALERGRDTIVIGRDGRLSGPELGAALAAGIRAAGANVIDIGMVATPMTYFAAHHLGTQCSVMVTGSHNPPDYNGLKMVIAGDTLSGAEIVALKTRIEAGSLATGAGGYRNADIAPAYLDRIARDVRLARPMKIAIDCGNGVAGAYAPALFRRLGCEVTELFCEVDGTFPNHHPDPSQPKNLADLIALLARGQHDLGLAFDGDGDRLGVVTPQGHIIYPDRQLMLFAADVLSREPGATVIYDVKSTRNLGAVDHAPRRQAAAVEDRPFADQGQDEGNRRRARRRDERPHVLPRALVRFRRRPLRRRAAARDPVAPCRSGAVLDALPDAVSTPELNVACAEGEHHALIAKLAQSAQFPGATDVIRIDGLRVEYADGFGLARGSNTTPVIVLRFEADDAAALARIQGEFRRVLSAAKPGIALPF